MKQKLLSTFQESAELEDFIYLFGINLSQNINPERAFILATHKSSINSKKILRKCVKLLQLNSYPIEQIFELLSNDFQSSDLKRLLKFISKIIKLDPKEAGNIVLETLQTLQKNRKAYEKQKQVYKILFIKMYIITLIFSIITGFLTSLSPLLALIGKPLQNGFIDFINYDFSISNLLPIYFSGIFLVFSISYKNMRLFKVRFSLLHTIINTLIFFGVSILLSNSLGILLS